MISQREQNKATQKLCWVPSRTEWLQIVIGFRYPYIINLEQTIKTMRKMIQVKGGLDETHEFHFDDTISSCKYSPQGTNLAIGDDSGRIITFDVDPSGEIFYSAEFKAHQGGHDWSNKKEIKPSVISLDWIPRNGSSMGLVSAAAKSIKFWRVLESSSKQMAPGSNFIPSLVHNNRPSYYSSQIKELPSLHSAYIKSINLSANQEYLLSTDGKTVLKWNTEKTLKALLLAEAPIIPEFYLESKKPGEKDGQMDIESQNDKTKQVSVEQQEYELEEWNALAYITNCKFHGSADNRLAYSTKMATINYLDMRCTNSTKPSIVMSVPTPNQFLRRYLNVISDFVFLNDGYSIASRDFLHIKIWDMRKSCEPVFKHSIFSSINWKIQELYEEMHHGDQFSMKLSPDGKKLLTGHLDCSFHEIDLSTNSNIRYRVNENNQCTSERVKGMPRLDSFDPDPKVQCIDYHPNGDSLSVTIRDSIFVFNTDSDSMAGQL